MVFFIIIFIVFFLKNIYQILLRYFDFFSVKKIILSMLWCYLFLIPINFLFYKTFYFPRSISFIAPVVICILILNHRIFINFIINLKLKSNKRQNNILIIGLDKKNLDILKYIRQDKEYGTIKAIIDPRNLFKSRDFNGIKIYKIKDLFTLVSQLNINEIIIGKDLSRKKVSEIFDKYENSNIRIKNLANAKNSSSLLDQITTSKLIFLLLIAQKIIKRKYK